MLHPGVIEGHAGVHSIFAFLCTFFAPAHNASQEPCVIEAVGVGASTVTLAGIFGLIVVSCTEHEGSDPGTAAALALRLIYEGNFNLLQASRRQSAETCATPSADRSWWIPPHKEISENPGPHANGSGRWGKGDGAFEEKQSDVMIVWAYAGIVSWMYVLLQNVVVLLCVLPDAQRVLSCKWRKCDELG